MLQLLLHQIDSIVCLHKINNPRTIWIPFNGLIVSNRQSCKLLLFISVTLFYLVLVVQSSPSLSKQIIARTFFLARNAFAISQSSCKLHRVPWYWNSKRQEARWEHFVKIWYPAITLSLVLKLKSIWSCFRVNNSSRLCIGS